LIPVHDPEPDPKKTRSRLFAALACYALIALLAGWTLDGNYRLFIWTFLALLAARTYLHMARKP
jgi:hypothetical protein